MSVAVQVEERLRGHVGSFRKEAGGLNPWGGIGLNVAPNADKKDKREEQSVDPKAKVEAAELETKLRELLRDLETEKLDVPISKIRVKTGAAPERDLAAIDVGSLKSAIGDSKLAARLNQLGSAKFLVIKAIALREEGRATRYANMRAANYKTGSLVAGAQKSSNTLLSTVMAASIADFVAMSVAMNFADDLPKLGGTENRIHELIKNHPDIFYEHEGHLYFLLPPHVQREIEARGHSVDHIEIASSNAVKEAHDAVDYVVSPAGERSAMVEKEALSNVVELALERISPEEKLIAGTYVIEAGEYTPRVLLDVSEDDIVALKESNVEVDIEKLFSSSEVKLTPADENNIGQELLEQARTGEADIVPVELSYVQPDVLRNKVEEAPDYTSLYEQWFSEVQMQTTTNDVAKIETDNLEVPANVVSDEPPTLSVAEESTNIEVEQPSAQQGDKLPEESSVGLGDGEVVAEQENELPKPVTDVVAEIKDSSAEPVEDAKSSEISEKLETKAEEVSEPLDNQPSASDAVTDKKPEPKAKISPEEAWGQLKQLAGDTQDSFKKGGLALSYFGNMVGKNTPLLSRVISGLSLLELLPNLQETFGKNFESASTLINTFVGETNQEALDKSPPHYVQPDMDKAIPFGWGYAAEYFRAVSKGKETMHVDYSVMPSGMYSIGINNSVVGVGEDKSVTIYWIDGDKNSQPALKNLWDVQPSNEDEAWNVTSKLDGKTALWVEQNSSFCLNISGSEIQKSIDKLPKPIREAYESISRNMPDLSKNAYTVKNFKEGAQAAQAGLAALNLAAGACGDLFRNPLGAIAKFSQAVNLGKISLNKLQNLGIIKKLESAAKEQGESGSVQDATTDISQQEQLTNKVSELVKDLPGGDALSVVGEDDKINVMAGDVLRASCLRQEDGTYVQAAPDNLADNDLTGVVNGFVAGISPVNAEGFGANIGGLITNIPELSGGMKSAIGSKGATKNATPDAVSSMAEQGGRIAGTALTEVVVDSASAAAGGLPVGEFIRPVVGKLLGDAGAAVGKAAAEAVTTEIDASNEGDPGQVASGGGGGGPSLKIGDKKEVEEQKELKKAEAKKQEPQKEKGGLVKALERLLKPKAKPIKTSSTKPQLQSSQAGHDNKPPVETSKRPPKLSKPGSGRGSKQKSGLNKTAKLAAMEVSMHGIEHGGSDDNHPQKPDQSQGHKKTTNKGK